MENKKTHQSLLIERTINALNKNNINGYFAEDIKSLIAILSELISSGQVVSFGGSQTLFESGVIDWLRSLDINLLDRYEEGLTAQDIDSIYFKSFAADIYLTSSNAITENGCLYNVDGRGNRVAAMIYGPKKVIVIAGVNKIVKDEEAAIKRNREISAPINAMRLAKKTPCAKIGYCTDCQSEERICSSYVFLKKQMQQDRIHVIFLPEQYGY